MHGYNRSWTSAMHDYLLIYTTHSHSGNAHRSGDTTEPPGTPGVQALIERLRLTAETRAEQILKEKNARRRSSDFNADAVSPPRSASAPITRSSSSTLVSPVVAGRPSV